MPTETLNCRGNSRVQCKSTRPFRVRVGVDSGPGAAGVVGDKIPHYSVFGDTVEMAGLMEATSEPMKIQAS
jgi:atrial natriuretic peptide receptor A